MHTILLENYYEIEAHSLEYLITNNYQWKILSLNDEYVSAHGDREKESILLTKCMGDLIKVIVCIPTIYQFAVLALKFGELTKIDSCYYNTKMSWYEK